MKGGMCITADTSDTAVLREYEAHTVYSVSVLSLNMKWKDGNSI